MKYRTKLYIAFGALVLISVVLSEGLDYLGWGLVISTLISLFIGLLLATYLSQSLTHSLHAMCEGVRRIGKGELEARLTIKSTDEFKELADAIHDMALGLQEKEHLKSHFIRYVSQHILERLQKDKQPLLEGEIRKVTILFADIREFSKLAEKLPPEQVVSQLNTFLSAMIDVIFEKDGTLDKFIGDGLMVEFGAPLDDPEQEKHAVETALGMQKTLRLLNEQFISQNFPSMQMVIGIHTGFAILGNIGSEKRTEYTAIGDTVNVAAHIEAAAKQLNVPILISETTLSPIRHLFQVQELGPVAFKGRSQPIEVFSIASNDE